MTRTNWTGGAIGVTPSIGEARIDRRLELREGARRRRRALVEQSEAAAQDRAARLVQPHRRADARRQVEPADNAVAIEPAAELRRPPRVRLKPILDEQRDVGAGDGLRRRSGEIQPARQRAVRALDQHRPAGAGAVVLVMQQVDAEFEQMRAAGTVVRDGHRFDHLEHAGDASLLVEEVARASSAAAAPSARSPAARRRSRY